MLASKGLDKKQALITAIGLTKNQGFKITKEACSKAPLSHEEFSKFTKVAGEESKEVGFDKVEARLTEIMADPVALA